MKIELRHLDNRDLVLEALKFPLYTIWSEGSSGHLVLAMFHGTGGDFFIAASALAVSLAIPTMLIGLDCTFFSEGMNVEVRHVWAYSNLMPRLPWIGTGLAPVLQWLVVPAIAFAVTWRMVRRAD